ncbi:MULTISPECIES: ribonuclease domain-containing protein [Thermocrispum]|jgi:guanyl-specific ribonuclease Sa|uniref:Ribonuclease N n=1 Tax=Thermocrispum agreste TaxID=37925 RepID=A0A2W4IYP2_9PSEU|nr:MULTISPECIES: ribonuclease domain-containing protein [Thermocrispum]PZM90735.1 MAG: ribonuclease N [Thermocrispum agreste]
MREAPPRRNRRRITAALVGLLLLVGAGWVAQNQWGGSATDQLPGAESGLPITPLSELPAEARQTWRLIQRGGPFPERQDGTVFGNREGLLPAREHGYYREYTVPTPNSPDRGARRLVTGEGDELYYTPDHYRSFVVVDPDR